VANRDLLQNTFDALQENDTEGVKSTHEKHADKDIRKESAKEWVDQSLVNKEYLQIKQQLRKPKQI